MAILDVADSVAFQCVRVCAIFNCTTIYCVMNLVNLFKLFVYCSAIELAEAINLFICLKHPKILLEHGFVNEYSKLAYFTINVFYYNYCFLLSSINSLF